MKAAIFRGKSGFSLEEYPLSSLKQGWVRVRIEEAGICGSDLHIIAQGYERSPGDMEGHIMGHENAGVIAELGEDVTGLKVGDRVGIKPWISCEKCSYCQGGSFIHCSMAGVTGYKYPGGFAQFIDVPETIAYKIPDSVSFSEATQLDGVACAVHALHVSELKPAETVVVIGDGTIGLYAMQGAFLSSPKHLVMVGKHGKNLDLASQFGATEIVDVSRSDSVQVVKSITGGKGADVVIEAVGRETDTVEDAIQMLAPNGRAVVMGVFTTPRLISVGEILYKSLKVVGSLVYGYWGDKNEFQMALELIADKKIKTNPLVTHKLKLEEIRQAFHIFTHKNESGAIKVMLIPPK